MLCARLRAGAGGFHAHGSLREEECVGVDALGGDVHAMMRGEAGRGPTRVLCDVARPALLRVAHVSEAGWWNLAGLAYQVGARIGA